MDGSDPRLCRHGACDVCCVRPRTTRVALPRGYVLDTSASRSFRFLPTLRLQSIRAKILVLAVVATLVPAVSTAALSYVRARSALTDTLEGELRGTGLQTARELDLWIKERLYDLRVFVGSFEVIENVDASAPGVDDAEAASRLGRYLTEVLDPFPEYAGLVALDRTGRPVARAEGSVQHPPIPEDWLGRLRLGEAMVGEPYWSDELSAVAATTAVPIQDADARFLGVLVATMTFHPLAEVLDALAPGDEGEIQVLSSDGRLVVATGTDTRFEVALPPDVLSRLDAAGGATVEYSDGGVERVGTLTTMEPLGWDVLVHLTAEDAYASVSRLTRTTVLLVSILLVAVGSVAYLVGLFITRPLARLAHAASAVAEGDLSVDLPVTGRDEVSYLTKVFNGMVARLRANAEALEEASASLREQNRALEQLSMTDGLTGLYNRRFVVGFLDKELGRASRHERSMSLLMMDIDDFKEFNDTFGHQAGDDVLAGLGEVLVDATRDADVPARYGGEEFVVVLPDTRVDGAVDAAERIRERLDREVFQGRKVTVSIGVAEYPRHGESATELIAAADVALYAAKDAGRDCVVAAEGRG